MQQFIPFEDDWDALANLRPEDLVPYRVGMLQPQPDATDQRTTPMSASITSESPGFAPMRRAVRAGSSST